MTKITHRLFESYSDLTDFLNFNKNIVKTIAINYLDEGICLVYEFEY